MHASPRRLIEQQVKIIWEYKMNIPEHGSIEKGDDAEKQRTSVSEELTLAAEVSLAALGLV